MNDETFRDTVLGDLSSIKTMLEQHSRDRTDHEARIRKLEERASLLMGGATIVTVVGGAVWSVVTYLLSGHR